MGSRMDMLRKDVGLFGFMYSRAAGDAGSEI